MQKTISRIFSLNKSNIISRTRGFSTARLNCIVNNSMNPSSNLNLVVLHGIFGSARNFRSLTRHPYISDLASSYLVDLRNHGNSEHRDTMTFKEMAMDVIELIREKGIESNFVLLGHSMGARVVMEIAGLYPLLPKGVIAVDLAPYDYMDDPRFGIIKKTYEFMSKVSDVDLNRRIEDIKNDIYKLTESREIGDLMLASIEHLSEKKYRWKMNIHGILSNYFQIMRDLEYSLMNKFEGPVKVICGSNSEYMTKDLVHFFHRPFSNFEESRDLVWIEGANHWVHFTQPTKFLFQVNSFLKKFAN